MTDKRNRTGLIIAGLLLGILVSAMDNTIVATAMGTIVAHLGGLNEFVWVSSAYMVTEMAGMPIFGKLSDMYGRKRFFVFGITVFFLGSILCGTATSIPQLIAYRALQGVGGGALAPIAFTILFDVVNPAQRGGMGGMFGAVFGLSSIFGPLLGAYITDHFSWRWVFYINVPLGIVCFLLVVLFYHESMQHSRQRVDWLGVSTLVPAIGSLMFALQMGGTKYPWNSAVILGLFVAAFVLAVLFIYVETRADEPIVPFPMFRNRLFAGSNLVALFSGGSYVVAVLYIPIFVQGVMGGSATNSGLILLPMMLSSVIASQIGILLARKMSFRTVMILSSSVFVVGFWLLGTMSTSTSHLTMTLYMIVVGLGIGASFSVLSVAAMQPFGMLQRGTASSTINFIREFAMAVGITIFGIIQKNLFASDVKASFAGMGAGGVAGGAGAGSAATAGAGAGGAAGGTGSLAQMDPHAMLSPATRAHIPPTILHHLVDSLSSSLVHTFLWTLIPAALALVVVWVMSGDKMTLGQEPPAKSVGATEA